MIKHRIKCFDSELLVRESGEASYELTIQSSSNPLGFGNALHTFKSCDEAVRAAEHFCGLYTAAREKGYYLREKSFIKPDREKIEVSSLLLTGMAVEEFAATLS
ncbi:hypothetical protein [Gorillibacterium timonense]|uniref:hypothetical protein n=1 Tax=Gorillibacterium timonense TaxID=1689269 RepID=UPI001F27080D|nr:hypothetical protein [Gorillibacterium timonense]